MESVIKVASHICLRYYDKYQKRIDEMKLHKLLYFCQRESIIQTGEPMFVDEFEAWKYGPVMVSIRHLYQNNSLTDDMSQNSIEYYKNVFDKIFEVYAIKDSWSLSTLTHGEYSWKKARGIVDGVDSHIRHIVVEDIRKDAERIKIRRFLLNKISAI